MVSKKKNVLVITSKYHVDRSNPYLSNDLVNELANNSGQVTVIGLGERSVCSKNGNLIENVISVNSSVKYLKYFLIWPKLFFITLKFLYKEKSVDQLIMFAPLIVLWPAAFIIKFFNIKRKVVIVFDIFPAHQLQIGSIPKVVGSVAKFLEKFLLNGFNEITAMGPNNKLYIEQYYSTISIGANVSVLPLWSRPIEINSIVDFNSEVTKFVFGGQIIKGREIETMINFLKLMLENGCTLSLDIYSKGAGFNYLKEKYLNLDWITFHDQIVRDKYYTILSNYHVGLIVTDRRVSLPTFPSKILDYVNAGLASYCIVEKESDLSVITVGSDLIRLNHFDFSNDEVLKSVIFIKSLKKIQPETLKASFTLLREYFSVKNTVARLLE